MPCKEIAHGRACNAEKRTSNKAVKEAADDHGLNVLRHGTWDQPNQKERKRDNVYDSSAIELFYMLS